VKIIRKLTRVDLMKGKDARSLIDNKIVGWANALGVEGIRVLGVERDWNDEQTLQVEFTCELVE